MVALGEQRGDSQKWGEEEREKEGCLRGHFDLKRPLYVGLVKEIHEDKC